MELAYMPGREAPEDHSHLYSLTVSVLHTMRRRIGLLMCLVVFCGIGLAMPGEGKLPLIVRNEIERLMSGSWGDGISETYSAGNFIGCNSDPELDMTTIELIRSSGYPAEEHFVTTPDGYILGLHRIPGPEGSTPVLLQHALLDSSFAWVVNGKGRGLAYQLADAGFDVWMGNVRGNTYSKNHTTLKPTDSEFWDFSWHEMGIYDIPTEISYIMSFNNQRVIYIGHSMGTTVFFVMKSERPDVASNVKAMFALAPVAYTTHLKGSLRVVAGSIEKIKRATNFDERKETLPHGTYMLFVAKCICSKPILRNLCQTFIFSSIGYNAPNANISMYPFILAHTPAGTSMKTILHYAQGFGSRRFRQYDYGSQINAKIYKSEMPPKYDLSKGDMPIELFWAENDFLARPEDVKALHMDLPKTANLHKIDDPNFNHLDFIWGINAPDMVNPKILDLIEKYRHSDNSLV